MRPIDAKEFIGEYFEYVWNRGDVPGMDRYHAPSYVHHDPSRPDVRTLEQYRARVRDLQGALDDMRVEVLEIVAEEDKAVARWAASGVHTGELVGIPPSGIRLTFTGVSSYRLENERIAEAWHVFDFAGLLRQLGALRA